MSYDKSHTEDDCDKCGKRIGKANLLKVPFLYMDCNDKVHPDQSALLGYAKDFSYRQYYVCKLCYKDEVHIK
jgi:hypothetical protein